MRDNIESIGLALAVEDIYALAVQLGIDAQQASRDEFGVKVEELEIGAAVWLRDSFKDSILRKGDNSMSATTRTESQPSAKLDTEAASSNMYWSYSGKEGRETFNIQTTVRGILSDAEIEAHISTAMKMMGAIVRHGGHAKPVGQQAPAADSAPAATNGHAKYTFTSKNGNSYVKFTGQVLEEIECPIHSVMAKKKDTQWGAQWSHRAEDTDRGWCNIREAK